MENIKNKNGTVSYKEKVTLPNKRTTTRTFKRKTDAVLWKRNMESEITRNQVLGISPLKEDMLFKNFFDLWMDRRIAPVRREKTIADYRSVGRKHLKSYFGDILLRSIERGHADVLIQKLPINMSAKTKHNIQSLFMQVMLFAEAENYVYKSPFRNFKKIKVPPRRFDYLKNTEVMQLLRSNFTEEIYPLLIVALNTGMRIGEIAGLCWDRISFETDLIEVSRSLSRNRLGDTKTHLTRHIPMNAEVKGVLQKLMREQNSVKYIFFPRKREDHIIQITTHNVTSGKHWKERELREFAFTT